MSTSRTVWGIGTSRTLRPQWALIELGLDYDHKKILPRGSGIEDPGFVALSKRHKVPFYQDDRVQIGESAAIVSYLADRYGGDNGLAMPEPGTEHRALLQDRTFFVMTEIDARLYTVRLHADPPLGLSATYGSAPVAIDAAKQYVDRQLHEAARWLTDGQQYVMGEQFGTIDILLVSCLDWCLTYQMELPAPLGEYRDRIALRPGYQTAMANNDLSNA
ncbi:MAG: glutathione S-transferase family protein [Prochloraceae cyanobacterium]